jgi:hypothetical protein
MSRLSFQGKLTTYIGDAVYVSFDGYRFWLETSNGLGITNSVALDSSVLEKFLKYKHKLSIFTGGMSPEQYQKLLQQPDEMDLYGDYEQKIEELVQQEITELKEVCKTPDIERIKNIILKLHNQTIIRLGDSIYEICKYIPKTKKESSDDDQDDDVKVDEFEDEEGQKLAKDKKQSKSHVAIKDEDALPLESPPLEKEKENNKDRGIPNLMIEELIRQRLTIAIAERESIGTTEELSEFNERLRGINSGRNLGV